ncbi:hypothetical protein EYZ11_012411 [Aspergillus tanneri]|uniref:Uncharacterized protein n=1 Tax=Aspergillus tanneri TaxID=1220188 RepID=A0A4S3J0W2_9EURO|nr:hypothetical protein EYZ11_012411 [Aspergillus tanneri]
MADIYFLIAHKIVNAFYSFYPRTRCYGAYGYVDWYYALFGPRLTGTRGTIISTGFQFILTWLSQASLE